MVVKNDRPRYLLVEFYRKIPDKIQLIRKLRNVISYLGGQIELAKSNVHLIDISDNFAIIRANHISRDLVEASIQLLDFSESIPVVRTVSGTIKKINDILKKEYEDISEVDDVY